MRFLSDPKSLDESRKNVATTANFSVVFRLGIQDVHSGSMMYANSESELSFYQNIPSLCCTHFKHMCTCYSFGEISDGHCKSKIQLDC